MSTDLKVLLETAQTKAVAALVLLDASLKTLSPYEADRNYSPKEREPYDALSDRFMRAVEIGLKFFRTYERYQFGENSDTLRDLLNRMEKLELISSTILWIQMREVRNRIVHDYLPEQIKEMYDLVMGEFGDELLALKKFCEYNAK